MILSRARNFIFIRTGKVAGTSIEFALSRLCTAPDDIVTTIGMPDEYRRFQLGVIPRNFAPNRRIEDDYAKILAGGNSTEILAAQYKMEPDMLFWGHMTARQIRDSVGEEFWNSAFKFTVVRHPYDYVVSQMYFRMFYYGQSYSLWRKYRHLAGIIFRQRINFDIISIDGVLAVDKVLHYENLKCDLRSIAPIIGGDISDSLPAAKSGIRPRHASVDASLGPLTKLLIRHRWKREFKAFSYRY